MRTHIVLCSRNRFHFLVKHRTLKFSMLLIFAHGIIAKNFATDLLLFYTFTLGHARSVYNEELNFNWKIRTFFIGFFLHA